MSLMFAIFAVIWRIIPVLNIKSKYDVGTDEYFHLYYIDLIKKNNNKLPKKNIFAYGGSNLCTYPSTFHILLSYFPREFVLKMKKYFSTTFDLLSVLIFSYVLITLFQVSVENIFFVITIYLLHPALIFCALGPRSFSLTPRSFAQANFLIGFSILLVYSSTFNMFYLQLSAVLFAISAMSSKFTVQVVLFGSIIMCIITASYDPIIYMLNISFWCLVFRRKTFLYQIEGQVRHSIWYFYEGYKFIKQRWQWNNLFLLLKNFKLRESWQIIMFSNPMTRVVLLNTPMFFYFFFIPRNDYSESQLMVVDFIYVSMVISFITNFSIFRIFGEPERYIEYVIGGVLFLFVTDTQSIMIYFSLVHIFIFILYSRRCDGSVQNKTLHKDIREVQEYLKNSKSIKTLCTSNNETYLFCGINVEFVVGFFSNNINSCFNKYFYSIYPDVNHINFSKIVREFNVKRIIVNKNKKEASLYNVYNYKKVFENLSYSVYEI